MPIQPVPSNDGVQKSQKSQGAKGTSRREGPQDVIAPAKGQPVKRSAALASDPIAGLEKPKAGPIERKELVTFFRLLESMGIMFQAQMEVFNSTMDTLQLQNTNLQSVMQRCREFSQEAIAKAQEIEKANEPKPWWEQLLIDAPMVIVGIGVAAATGGVGAVAIAALLGTTFALMSVQWSKGGENGWDELTGAMDKGINDMTGSKMDAKTQRWVNFGLKLGITIAASVAVGAGVNALMASAENVGADIAEGETEEALGGSLEMTEMGSSVGEDADEAIAATGEELDVETEVGADEATSVRRTDELVTKAEDEGLPAKGGKLAKKGIALLKKRQVQATMFALGQAIEMLQKWTSIEGTDGSTALRQENTIENFVRAVYGNPTTEQEMEAVDKKDKAAEQAISWSLTALNFALSIAGMAAPGAAESEGSIGQKVMRWASSGGQAIGNVASGVEQVGESVKMAKLSEVYADLATIREKQELWQGALNIDQAMQQFMNQGLVSAISENDNRVNIIWGLFGAMEQAVQPLIQG